METSRPTWIMIQNVFGLIAGYLVYYLILRHAGVVAFGIFSFALSFGSLFSFISDLGINTAQTKMISEGKDRNEYSNAFILLKIFLTLIYISAVLLSLFVWRIVLHHGFESKYELLSIIILIPYFFSLPFIQGIRSFFTGTLEAAKMAIPSIAETAVRLVAVVILIQFNIFNIGNIDQMAEMIAVSYTLSYLVYFAMYYRFGRPWNFRWPRFTVIREYLHYSYPLMGASIVLAVSSNLAQIMIQSFFHSYELGGYASAVRIITMLSSFSGSLTILILPLLASHKGSAQEYVDRLVFLMKYIALFVSPIIMFAYAFSAPILNLWSSQLIPFSFTLQLLLVATWFTVLLNPYQSHFNATGETGISAFLSIVGAVLIIILDLVLIPGKVGGLTLLGYGVNGAAIATLISGIATYLTASFLVYRSIKVFITLDTIKSVAISVALIIPFYWYFDDNSSIPFLILAGLFVAYSVIYLLIIRALKILSREEFKEILNTFNVKKLVRYALNEIKKPSQ